MRTAIKLISSSLFSFLILSFFGVSVLAQTTAPKRPVNQLTEAKMKMCQGLERGIDKRIMSLNNLSENMYEKFGSITERMEEYYAEKVLPSGKSVPNYSTLISDVAAKKANAQAALNKAESNVSDFSCDGENPKGVLTQYRLDMQAVKLSLKNYRTSVKNLIVAVRSVTGTTEKLSPKPTSTE